MKKGFTLVELLAVIAILGVLMVIVLPNVIDNYNESIIKKMSIEENNISDAAEIFVEEHCKHPLKYAGQVYTCPLSYGNNPKYICLNDLQNPVNYGNSANEQYIGEVKFKSDVCKGIVVIEGHNRKTFLYCGALESGSYPYSTGGDGIVTNEMKTACGIS